MNHTTRLTIASVVTLGATLAAAPYATAGGPGDDRHHHGGGLDLTDEAEETLARYDVDVAVLGGRHEHRRTDGRHGGESMGIAFVGDDAASKWKDIRFDDDSGTVTAVVNGKGRAAVLTVDADDRRHDRRAGGRHGHDGELDLTAAGAASINRAAGADAFDAGDALAEFGWDRD
jgi:hypothetical protein